MQRGAVVSEHRAGIRPRWKPKVVLPQAPLVLCCVGVERAELASVKSADAPWLTHRDDVSKAIFRNHSNVVSCEAVLGCEPDDLGILHAKQTLTVAPKPVGVVARLVHRSELIPYRGYDFTDTCRGLLR